MNNETVEKVWAASGGATFTTIGSVDIWKENIIDVPLELLRITGGQFAFEIMLKSFATIILAIFGGIFGMLAKDIYSNLIKPKIFKNGSNSKQKQI